MRAAEECVPPGPPEFDSDRDLPGVLPDRQIYADVDPCDPLADCLVSAWVYEESNDRPGLQREDFRIDHTCGQGGGDTFVALLFAAQPLDLA